jgi:cysteine synthase A
MAGVAREAPSIDQRFAAISHLVGNTPLLAIDCSFNGGRRTIYAKAEHLNLTGSIKDRMALHILRSAYLRGALKPNGPIIEVSSGNTGIAFAAMGRALGHPVTIFMADWMSQERVALIGSYGAEVVLISRQEGGFLGGIRMAEDLAARLPGAFLPHQFSNDDNCDAHASTTGPEIWWQLRSCGRAPDAFVAGVGTGGTVMGVGRYLRSKQPNVAMHPLEPANSPTLSTGCKVGKHRIEGISDGFIPAIVDLAFLDEVVSIEDGDAILMAQKLASEIGLGVGISSGANFLGALLIQEKYGKRAIVVTVFPDDNKKYVSTDLLRREAANDSYFSPGVKLLRYRSLPRNCHTCTSSSRATALTGFGTVTSKRHQ